MKKPEEAIFHFNTPIQRMGTGSLKWDGAAHRFGGDVLPMWVADMDFAIPECIISALQQRLEHPIFGYPSDEPVMLEAAEDWMEARHGWRPEPGAAGSISGVVPALFAAVRAFTRPGDSVIVMPPIYPPFMTAVQKNDRELLLAPLQRGADHDYSIDWPALEKALSRSRLLLLCSPHNPVGRVWSAAELQRLADLCSAAHCVVVSDEIHADLSYTQHIPFPVFSSHSVLLSSAGKSFNIAGIGGGIAIIPDPELRQVFRDELYRSQIHQTNACALKAMTSAWKQGAEWQTALRHYLLANARFMQEFLRRELPDVGYRIPEFGYLAWLDVSSYGDDTAIQENLLKAGLGLNLGPSFGPGGAGFVRLNFATPRATLEEGLSRLRRALLS
ncbi:PatB family C-S lyase [Acidithiobacillus sp. M4-SHS-6]|uniref:PatB family C-S lyase n=1 Tax=Acidithiobacillus sp. M4-SHS-6 TaxID=3383024 RepID=UPI0039BE219D